MDKQRMRKPLYDAIVKLNKIDHYPWKIYSIYYEWYTSLIRMFHSYSII